jgi:hypothetical protein
VAKDFVLYRRRRSRISCQTAITTMVGVKSMIAVVLSKARIAALNVSLINPTLLPRAASPLCRYIVKFCGKREKGSASSWLAEPRFG